MDKRNQRRPPLTLLPFVLMLFLTLCLWLAVNGGITNPAIAMQSRDLLRQSVVERVHYAVESLNRGEKSNADIAVTGAVQTLGGTSSALVDVAQELLRFDRPAYVAVLLGNFSKRPEFNWDPMLWATLAKAQERAGNKEEVAPAMDEANKRAGAILFTINSQTPPVKDDRPTPQQQDMLLRLTQAGEYYSEIKPTPDKALRALREAQRIWPENPLIQNALGYTLVDLGTTPTDIDEGFVLTKRAATTAPESGTIRDSYGWALYRKGDLTSARRVLREAADMEPDVPEIRYHLGMVYAKLGLPSQAELELNRALDLRPDYVDAEKAKAQLKAPH